MKLLHTSDWHLGQNFMAQSRYKEHKAFLDWLLDTIKQEKIDLLIVAGDIFDTQTPPNYALELYYNFLTKLSSICKHTIIIAGNHDSIATLKAPKQLLNALNITVIASGDEDEDEIVELRDDNKLQAIVCGVPFLRDYVVRSSFSGEGIDEKEYSLTKGIKEHYKKVYLEALKRKGKDDVPIIATGHLSTVGSKLSDSEVDIYIGGSLNIQSDFLSEMFDYTALGHLHINQNITSDTVCYSGSAIPLGFNEAKIQKRVNIVTFEGKKAIVKNLDIPLFRNLYLLKGNKDEILEALDKIEDKDGFIEVHLEDENLFFATQQIREKSQKLSLKLLAIKVQKQEDMLLKKEFKSVSLDELNPLDVFVKRLEKDSLEDEEFKKELLLEFKKVLFEVQNR
jgi:exonuclease SbcD